MLKQFLKYILLLPAILFVLLTSPQAQAVCTTAAFPMTNWSAATWTGCSTSPPSATDDVVISNDPLILNQDATVKSVTVSGSGSLGGNSFLTLTATEPIIMIGVSDLASRVKLSIDKDHTINGNIAIFGLQWATSLTAPRTLTINGTIDLRGGGFNLDGTATNPVILTGTGNIMNGDGSGVMVNNCAGKSVSMTHVTCSTPIGNNPVSAPIFSLKDKPAIFSEEVK